MSLPLGALQLTELSQDFRRKEQTRACTIVLIKTAINGQPRHVCEGKIRWKTYSIIPNSRIPVAAAASDKTTEFPAPISIGFTIDMPLRFNEPPAMQAAVMNSSTVLESSRKGRPRYGAILPESPRLIPRTRASPASFRSRNHIKV